MVTEEISETDKNEEGKPPRETPIFRIFHAFNRTIGREKAKRKKAETDHQRNERTVADWSRRVGAFTAILAITSIIGNWIIYKQLLEMQSSGEDTKRMIKAAEDSAKTAQDAVALSKENAQRQLRAYVSIEGIACVLKGDKIKVTVSLRNSGQTPAYDALPQIPDVTFWPISTTENNDRPRAIVGHDITVYANTEFSVANDSDVFFAALKKEGSFVRILGKTEYRDAFGQSHYLTFKARSTRFEDNAWTMMPEPDGNEAD